ncbi:MAG: ATP synthase F0 subunit B [Proteobacteria bacterium]|nr:ATP synthase F0 subunit B [Pseudomonadota bacterium]MBU1640612.1 ATP synthase F0 subunit B [Pseudomonadota bacterium]
MRRDVNWSKLGLSVLAVVAVVGLTALAYASGDPHAAEAAHGGGHGGGGLGLTPAKLKDLGWRAMNFAALLIILVKFLKKPIVDGLRGRRQGIREEFDDLESQRSAAERQYQEYASRLSGLDAELKKMVETAVAQGEVEKERIIAEANEAASQIKRQAELSVANAVAEAKVKLKREVADQAAVMAQEIIKKNLQPADQIALVEGYLAKVGGVA